MVGSSTLPPGIFENGVGLCPKVSSGRHYIGSAVDLHARFAQHQRGHTHTTKRLGENLQIIATREVATLREARRIERMLKAKKNPESSIYHLQH
ncbi:MAG: GIY-YIG nuclease family protein [Nitrospirota bacterium]